MAATPEIFRNHPKELPHAYGFDEVAIVPGEETINPELCEPTVEIAGYQLKFPILAAAMDAVVDPDFAVRFSRLGSLAVLNLEGIQTRYQNPEEVLVKIRECPTQDSTSVIQEIYRKPIEENLVFQRIKEIKERGGVAIVSSTPQMAKRLGPIAAEAGVDIFVVQSTVTTARHISTSQTGLGFKQFVDQMEIPVVVGNIVTFKQSYELMEEGVASVLCGVGPGAACTSREVLGIGVPQITATLDCASARDQYFKKTGRYVPIITDGGIVGSGDFVKALVAGADAVMIGSMFVACREAPGQGYNWGMSTSDNALPRGTRVKIGIQTDLEKLLFGPTSNTAGKENLVGALKIAMGMCGARTIGELRKTELVHAPAIKTEGKIYQNNPQI